MLFLFYYYYYALLLLSYVFCSMYTLGPALMSSVGMRTELLRSKVRLQRTPSYNEQFLSDILLVASGAQCTIKHTN